MMTQILRVLNKCVASRLINSCVLTLSLAITQTALAEYQPPPDQLPPSGHTSTTGPRGGCESNEGPILTVLAPQKHVGQTASVRPTFAWFVPDSKPFPVEFVLYKFDSGSGRKLVQKMALQTSPGIMKLSLPEDKPGLVVGQRYLWQVAVLCDPNSPSSDLVAKAEIQVVEMPPDLKKALSTQMVNLEIVQLYAKAGLWYDALSEALQLENSRLREVTATLLEDLAKVEEATATRVESQLSSNLRQIAKSERQQSVPRS